MTLKLITRENHGSVPLWLWIIIAAVIFALIVVIAIAIGVFIFIMSTTSVSENCTSDNTQIIYVDHTVNSSGVLQLRLQNGSGTTIKNVTADASKDFDGIGTIHPTTPVSGQEFTITGITSPSSGTYRGSVNITYTQSVIEKTYQRNVVDKTHTATITCTGTAE